MKIELSADQQVAHDAAVAFLQKPTKDHFTIGGLAGTGKTTITSEIVRTLRRLNPNVRFAFACYTGKAALVLKTKLLAAGMLKENETCSTIHKLIYEAIIDQETGEIIGWNRAPAIPADFIIVDEASMVNEEIWNDLKSYRVPILAIGDHGQLPPVKEQYNLMEHPDVRLERIHRQAEGDPIIRLSMMARTGEPIKNGQHGPGVWKVSNTPEAQLQRLFQNNIDIRKQLFLCGYNRTRALVNRTVRQLLGYPPELVPHVGEPVLCLKNNHEEKIFNGMMGTVRSLKPGNLFHKAQIEMVDETLYRGRIVATQFGALTTLKEHDEIEWYALKDLFDFGYCLTVHKAQGSESESVVLFDEHVGFLAGENATEAQKQEFQNRWRYTGITRARRTLTIVSKPWKNFASAASGLLVVEGRRLIRTLRQAQTNKNAKPFSAVERQHLYELASMRTWTLKEVLADKLEKAYGN